MADLRGFRALHRAAVAENQRHGIPAILAEALEHRAVTLETYIVTNTTHRELGTPQQLADRVRVLRREAKRLRGAP